MEHLGYESSFLVVFLRFNLQSLGAMRLLMATSEVCLCEAMGLGGAFSDVEKRRS